MKTVVIVAPHFLPSFNVSVHRSRLWTYHLEEFGWHPIILTTDPKYYEGHMSEDMLSLLPPGLEIIRTKALPTKPIRLIGDIGIRSLPWYYLALKKLSSQRKIDFLHITIPAFPAALLGNWVTQNLGIPFGLDYIDPWIPETPVRNPCFSKAWLARRLSNYLEPLAVRRVRLITGINEAYFTSVIRRNPHLAGRVETAGMPYGNSDLDYEALTRKPRPVFLFQPDDGNIHLIYAGALLPKGFGVLEALFRAFVRLRERNPVLASKVRFHFVGTGCSNDPVRGLVVQPYIEKYGLTDFAEERPARIGYLDVLNHLRASAAILVLGSTEIHYSPSKLYQSVMSRRPVFAMLHEQSTACQTMKKINAGQLVTFNEHSLPEPETLCGVLEAFLQSLRPEPTNIDLTAFREVSARETTRILANAFDRTLERISADSV